MFVKLFYAVMLVITCTVLCSTQEIQQLTVTEGDNIKLPCTLSLDYPRWTGPELYNGLTQPYNNQGHSNFPNPNVPEQKKIRLAWDNDKSSLIIRDVILSDMGNYTCASAASINLMVRVPPKAPRILNTESVNGTLILRASQSQKTTFVCISSGGYPQPVVEWYRANTETQPLTSTTSVNIVNNTYAVTKTYSFTPQRQDDGVQYICQSSFETQPRHVATTSAELLLNLKPNTPQILQTSVVSAGNQAIVRCITTGSRPAASITWSYDNTNRNGEETTILDSATKTYTVISLLKLQVTATDNGQAVQCKVSHILVNADELTASLNLDVRFSVQASSTKLTGNKEIEATGRTPLTLNCTTGSSNPASSITWFNGSVEITNLRSYSTWTGTNNGQVKSQQFVLYPTRYMDGDVIKCSVSNNLNSQTPVSTSTALNVKYSPVVTIEGQQQYSLTEGDNKTLSCKVESKPHARITWYHNDVRISQDSPVNNNLPYSLSPVNRTHYGVYKCEANNGVGNTDKKTITINVKFKPLSTTIMGDTNIIANGRNTVQLTCTSDSSYPISDITWRKNSIITPATGNPTEVNGDYGGKKRRVSLTLTPTRYDDGDIISCEAKNTIGTSERSTNTLDLRYRPLINPMTDIIIVEGDKATFPCNASSKPVSTFKWYREGQLLKEGTGTTENNGLTFTITKVNRTDAGTYICNADNGVETPDNKNVLLTVQYPPDVKVIAFNTTINASRLVITCNATGVPSTGYKYGKWIQRWPGYESSVQEYTDGGTLELRNLTYEHSGLYSCSASNGIKVFGTDVKFIDGSVNLVVESFPVITDNNEKVSAKLEENATLFIEYFSNVPDSHIELYKNINGFREGKLIYSVSKTDAQVDLQVFSERIKTSGTKANILIPIKTKADLGIYDVVVSNKIGHVLHSFNIVPKGPPSMPSNVTVIKVQYNNVRVSWIAGYHGGSSQTFVILTSTDQINWKTNSVHGGLSERQAPIYYILSDLSPSTTYYMKMYSYNIDGQSLYTNILQYTTPANNVDKGEAAASSTLVTSSLVVAAVAIVFAVVVIIAWRKGITPETLRQKLFAKLRTREESGNNLSMKETTITDCRSKDYEQLQSRPDNEYGHIYENSANFVGSSEKNQYEVLGMTTQTNSTYDSLETDPSKDDFTRTYENLKV